MASATFPAYDLAVRSRRQSFILPREHGVWGMPLVALAVGAAAGNPHHVRFVWILLFAIASLGIFCLRTPVESASGLSPVCPQNDGERGLIHFFIFYYASAALLAIFALISLGHEDALIPLGLTAGAYYFATGGFDSTAMLWRAARIPVFILAALIPIGLKGLGWFIAPAQPL